jgi:hypothetical protein
MMVDSDDVLRNPATKKVQDKLFRQRLAEFNAASRQYELPEKAELERAVEERDKCGKCGGGVRAVLEDAQPYDGTTADLEILVSLNCRDAVGCKWAVRQWRPWRQRAPLDL